MYYTKYRPQKFSEVSKTSEAAEALAKQMIAGKTVHAYLFVGSRGTGKTSTARILAKAVNCTDIQKDGDPCDKCHACLGIKEGNFIDLHEIDAASNRGIDDIRDLRERIKLAPAIGKNKVYIIDEVHMLTTEAFNALLKTLEEPPKNTIFILCTTEMHKVPETIRSRCQVYKFKRATSEQLVDKLVKISKEEKLKVSKGDLEKIARASTGGFRDAETLLQQVAEGDIDIENLISISSKNGFLGFVKFLVANDAKSCLEIVNSVYDDGIDLYVWVGELIRYLRSMIMLKSGVSVENLDYPKELFEDDDLIKKVTIPWLVSSMEFFLQGHVQIKNSYAPQVPVEIAVLKIVGDSDIGTNTNDVPRSVSPIQEKSIVPDKKQVKDTDSTEIETKIDEPALELDQTDQTVEADLQAIYEKWGEVLEKVREFNSSIQALLKSGKVLGVKGRFVIIEVYYAFHKERLESPKNRSIIEKVLSDLHGKPLSIKCEVASNKPPRLADREVGVLTDMNVVLPASEKFDRDSVLSMLNGGLPL